MSRRLTALDEFLDDWAGSDKTRRSVRSTLLALARATAGISEFVASAPLDDKAPAEIEKLRRWLICGAQDRLSRQLQEAPVAAFSCQKDNGPKVLNKNAALIVAADSMDGSSNIEANAPVGGIFSIMKNTGGKADADSFLQPGRNQLAAGFMMYGPQTLMVFTVGQGTHVATLDRASETFMVTSQNLAVRQTVREYAINASNYRHWDKGTRAYIDDCLAGTEGPRGANYTMRWVAALVAESYRVLVRGAVFLYPRDIRSDSTEGRLWLLHEAFPIAMVIEQAGGKATNGTTPILDLTPARLSSRTPLVFGPPEEVERIRKYIENPPVKASSSPLFGQRGLFRN